LLPIYICLILRSIAHPELHSFPTRRSSDLNPSITFQKPRKGKGSWVKSLPTKWPTPIWNWATRSTHRTRSKWPPNSITTAKSRRSEEHTSELQSRENLVCRLLLEKKKENIS